MAKKLLTEVLSEASKLKTKPERVSFLQKNRSPALMDILRVAYDDDIVSMLPKGAPTYRKDDAPAGHEFTTFFTNFWPFNFYKCIWN